jgi:hypothetical protein
MPGKQLGQIIIGLCWWRQIVFQNEQQQMLKDEVDAENRESCPIMG